MNTDAVSPNAENLATVCVLCSHNCGIRVDVKDNKIVKVRPDESSPITHGYICNKGITVSHYVNHAQRVTEPLRRRPDGTYETVSWETAISEIAAKLKPILKKHGGNALALIGVGGQANHLNGYGAIPFMIGTGSPWWFNALGQEKSQHPLVDGWMFGSTPDTLSHPQMEKCQYLLMLGTNPLLSNRGQQAGEYIKAFRADPARTLVVVDPRLTETASRADRYLRIRPGGDVHFLTGVAAAIVQNGWTNNGFLSKWTSGTDAVLAKLKKVSVADMAERCGIPEADIVDVARSFAKAKSAGIYTDLGVEQGRFSTLAAYYQRLICVLTGHYGNEGGMAFVGTYGPKGPPLRQAQHKAPVSGIEGIPMLIPLGLFSPSLFPEEVLSGRPDRIRAAIVDGSNPVVQFTDSAKYREAFRALDLSVVIEPALSETAREADYVLPTPVGYEKWEYAGFPKHYPEIHAQVRPPVLQGPPNALPEAEIYYRLVRAMGLVEETPAAVKALAKRSGSGAGAAAYFAALSAMAAFKGGGGRRILLRSVFWGYDSMRGVLPSPSLSALWLLTHGYAATRGKELARTFPETSKMLLPTSKGAFLWKQLMEHPEGVEVGRLDPKTNLKDNIHTKDGKIRLDVPQMMADMDRALAWRPAPDGEFPFILNGGRRTNWNANTIQRNPEWRRGKGPHCPVYLHPVDADRVDVKAGENVKIETRTGSVTLPVALDENMSPGNIAIPNGFGLEYPDPVTGKLVRTGVNINELTDGSDRDPHTGCPHLKYVECRVTAVR